MGATISYVSVENNLIPLLINESTEHNQIAVQLTDETTSTKMYIVYINSQLVCEADSQNGSNSFYLNIVSVFMGLM